MSFIHTNYHLVTINSSLNFEASLTYSFHWYSGLLKKELISNIYFFQTVKDRNLIPTFLDREKSKIWIEQVEVPVKAAISLDSFCKVYKYAWHLHSMWVDVPCFSVCRCNDLWIFNATGKSAYDGTVVF